MNCYDIKIWRLSDFDSQQRYGNKYYFVLAVSIDKQLFYEHEFKFANQKFCNITKLKVH